MWEITTNLVQLMEPKKKKIPHGKKRKDVTFPVSPPCLSVRRKRTSLRKTHSLLVERVESLWRLQWDPSAGEMHPNSVRDTSLPLATCPRNKE